MNENEYRDLIATTAERDAIHGTIYEWSDELNGLIALYNNYPNIGRGIKYSPTLGGWCMLYVSTLFIQYGIGDIIQPEIGAYEPMKNAKMAGRWKSRKSGYIPKRGDIIHYAFPRTDEKGNTFTQYHVGIVTNADANVIYSTEGNVENRVVMRGNCNWIDNEDIDGFILPEYEKISDVVTVPAPPTKDGNYMLTATVIEGEYELTWKEI